MRKHNQLKQFVYALFTQEQEKSSYEIRNCLISFVDQPGLEPCLLYTSDAADE